MTKLNALFSASPARIRAADPSQGLERTEADWQDARSHLRAVDRSGEHLVGIVSRTGTRSTNLPSLRTNKPVDPFALDPDIAARHQERRQRPERRAIAASRRRRAARAEARRAPCRRQPACQLLAAARARRLRDADPVVTTTRTFGAAVRSAGRMTLSLVSDAPGQPAQVPAR